MRDMPEHQGIAALLSGAHINYFHCLKIVTSLVAAGGHVGALAGAMMAGSCLQSWSAHTPKSTCAVKALEEGLKSGQCLSENKIPVANACCKTKNLSKILPNLTHLLLP